MKNHQSTRYQKLTILASILCTGYIASLFLTYSFIVMPGLATLDDRAFVAAFQGLETRFQNADNIPGYESFAYGNIPALIAFPGAILFGITAIILNWKKNYLKWIIGAVVLFGIGMVSTVFYNLPFNETIFSAGDPNQIDVAQVRKDFNETAWLNWNHFRGLTTLLSMLCFMKALHLSAGFTSPD